MGMSEDDERYIEREILKRLPKLATADPTEIYSMCREAYSNLDGNPQDWVMQEFVNPETFKKVWYWRRKS